MFRNKKFPGFVHPYNLLKYFQNKEIDSNRNTSIQMDLSKKFLNRGSNKFYCSSPKSFSSFFMETKRGRPIAPMSSKFELFR